MREGAGSSAPGVPAAAHAADAAAPFKQSKDDDLTFEQLEQWYLLAGCCAMCSHTGWLDRWELSRRYGKRTPIVTLFPRLRCTKCNNRIGNRMKLGRMKR